jgi:hypothetical protein
MSFSNFQVADLRLKLQKIVRLPLSPGHLNEVIEAVTISCTSCLYNIMTRSDNMQLIFFFWIQRLFYTWASKDKIKYNLSHSVSFNAVWRLKIYVYLSLKGQCHEILDSQSTAYRSLINRLKPFRIWLRIRRDNRFESRQNRFQQCQGHRWNRKWSLELRNFFLLRVITSYGDIYPWNSFAGGSL